MRPWWETHPREHWTAEDRRAARKAGALPRVSEPYLDPAVKLLNASVPKVAWGAHQSQEERRSGAASRELGRLGIR